MQTCQPISQSTYARRPTRVHTGTCIPSSQTNDVLLLSDSEATDRPTARRMALAAMEVRETAAAILDSAAAAASSVADDGDHVGDDGGRERAPFIVALQLPDSMLHLSLWLTRAIRDATQAAPVKPIVLADCVGGFGSCCVDEHAAMKLGARMIVHYGGCCFTAPTRRIPAVAVRGRFRHDAVGGGDEEDASSVC